MNSDLSRYTVTASTPVYCPSFPGVACENPDPRVAGVFATHRYCAPCGDAFKASIRDYIEQNRKERAA